MFVLAVLLAAGFFIIRHRRDAPPRPVILVTIPEGSTVYEIDRILSAASVIGRGQLIAAAAANPALEGTLFPDTYYFYASSSVAAVVDKMTGNFAAKAAPLLIDPVVYESSTASSSGAIAPAEQDLIVASMLQKEVASSTDQEMVAGIIEKRLKAGMPLDIDATICYAKQQAAPTSTEGCYPLKPADFAASSSYNTYLRKGLPPGPIGNPGLSAIEAALHPAASPYWYYLSDPKTQQTIYAVSLAQQTANETKYLR